jgi:thymidylate synthase (FAD)
VEEQIIVQLNPDVPPTGSDLGIVNAARKSFGKRSDWEIPATDMDMPRLKDKDKRLLEFLARGMTADDFDKFLGDTKCQGYFAMHESYDSEEGVTPDLVKRLWQWRNTPTHDTPFNHSFFSFEVKIPMFTARQLVKTEYTILSEISRRYITEDIELYLPDYRLQSKDRKQGSSGSHTNNKKWQVCSLENAARCVDLYNKMVADGVAIEQARGELPVNLMVEWTWSGTLGAMAKMCRERMSPDAQYETRLVAQQVYEELKKQFPVAAPLLVEGVY